MNKTVVKAIVNLAVGVINGAAGLATVIVAKKAMKVFVEPAVRESITKGVESAFKLVGTIKNIGKIKNII